MKSLLLMSDYFDVSLDELVKGDLQMMKEKVGVTTLNHYSLGMMIGFVLTIFGTVFFIKTMRMTGVVSGSIGIIVMFYSAIQVEKIKKKLAIQTYSEIVAYMEGKNVVPSHRMHPVRSRGLKLFLSDLVTFVILYLSLIFF